MKADKTQEWRINIDTDKLIKPMAKTAFITGLIISGVITASMYFEQYSWSYQSPIIFQSPIVVSKRDNNISLPVVPSVEAQEVEISQESQPETGPDINKMVDGIHALESSRGNNKAGLAGYCEALGMTNEYGYSPDTKHCFKTKQQAHDRIVEWVHDHLPQFDNDEAMTMCFYNTGKELESCEYYINYLKLGN